MIVSEERRTEIEIGDVIHLLVVENLFFLLTQVIILHGSKVNVTLTLSSRGGTTSSESAIEEEVILLLLVVIVVSTAHHATHVMTTEDIIIKVEIQKVVCIIVIVGGVSTVLRSLAVVVSVLRVIGGRE